MDSCCSPRDTCSAVPPGIVKITSWGGRAVSCKNKNGTSLTNTPISKPSATESRIFLTIMFLDLILCLIRFLEQQLQVMDYIFHGRTKWKGHPQISLLVN